MTMQSGVVDVSSFTTDAKFRTWGSAMSVALQACGLVLTTDTGQINWTTVLKATVTNTKQGYEIYKFADSLQATKPVFIRFDYGSSAVTSGNGPCVWITIGTGSNGSGTITGPTVGPVQLNTSSGAPANTGMTYQFTHSTANGYLLANFGMALTAASGLAAFSSPGVLILERTKDSTGTPTGDGITITYDVVNLGQGTWTQAGINFNTSTVITTTSGTPLISPLTGGSSLSTSGVSALYKQYSWIGSLFYAVGVLGYFNTDQTNGATFTATPVGTTPHSYYCWVAGTNTASVLGATGSVAAAWAWEN